MSRYIDADALIKWINGTECFMDVFKRVTTDIINKQPTVDAVPVVHAYWIIKPHGTYGQLRAFCSACGKHSGIGGIVSNQKKPYCPNCGARTRKGERGKEK